MNDKFIGQRVIARGVNSGVYYGTLTERNGQECVLANVRNIWRWSGATALPQLANEGVKDKENSRFTDYVSEIVLTDVCELLSCTEAAIENIESVEVWRVD